MKIRYHLEDKPLGTAGAIGTIDGLDEPFFVMNGDQITGYDEKPRRVFGMMRKVADV